MPPPAPPAAAVDGAALAGQVQELDGRREPEQVRAGTEAVLTRYHDAPVRSFLLTLADGRVAPAWLHRYSIPIPVPRPRRATTLS